MQIAPQMFAEEWINEGERKSKRIWDEAPQLLKKNNKKKKNDFSLQLEKEKVGKVNNR